MRPCLLLLIALLCLPAAAAGRKFDINAKDFWFRSYPLSNHAETYLIEIRVDDPDSTRKRVEKILSKLGGEPAPAQFQNQLKQMENVRVGRPDGKSAWTSRTKDLGPSGQSLLWEVPSEKAETAALAVVDLGTIETYKKSDFRQRGGHDPEELIYKQDTLLKERPKIEKRLEKMPAVAGLLEEELRVLDELARKYKKSKESALVRIDLSSGKK